MPQYVGKMFSNHTLGMIVYTKLNDNGVIVNFVTSKNLTV
jgi:hypothetical protein